MKKYWIPIIAVLAAAVIGVAVWLIFFNDSTPPTLSQGEKDQIKTVYLEKWCMGDDQVYAAQPFIWYDENGQKEENNVWRYIGKYGDYCAILRIGDNKSDGGTDVQIPYPIKGLSREVRYAVEAKVILYHADGIAIGERGYTTQLLYLDDLVNLANPADGLTDAQLEQLTADIEKMAAGN